MTSQEISQEVTPELALLADAAAYGDYEYIMVFCRWMSEMSDISDKSINEAISHTERELA
jgi:hypothetical protein